MMQFVAGHAWNMAAPAIFPDLPQWRSELRRRSQIKMGPAMEVTCSRWWPATVRRHGSWTGWVHVPTMVVRTRRSQERAPSDRQFRCGGVQFGLQAFERQGEVERAAFTRGGFGPTATGVAFDDALGQRETGAGALEVHGVVLPLEHHKQVVCFLQVEAHTVVGDEESASADRVDLPAELDACHIARPGVLHGIAQQVAQGLAQQREHDDEARDIIAAGADQTYLTMSEAGVGIAEHVKQHCFAVVAK